MNDNKEIVIMVKALGDFMRSNISGPEFITIEKELENIHCYLTIQKFRYNDKLDVRIDIPPDLYHAKSQASYTAPHREFYCPWSGTKAGDGRS